MLKMSAVSFEHALINPTAILGDYVIYQSKTPAETLGWWVHFVSILLNLNFLTVYSIKFKRFDFNVQMTSFGFNLSGSNIKKGVDMVLLRER